ncbi:MAG: metal-binding protein [Burkholderiales bacterium RIFCSPLOWO2_02_FULL_57_36]|nr:MAG: metal-binding protein [Burkholderiales bacterium RIFCSPLOWO2_02_FULL_57_36]
MKTWKKTIFMTLLVGTQLPALAAGIPVNLYKNPHCGCCDVYAEHLKTNGFEVKMINTNDMASVKQKYSVPEKLEGCHTATINGYVFEGLIPAEHIKRVLTERLPLKGLSVPGMPVGAPGMPGNKKGPIHVYYLSTSSSPKIFASF